MTQKSPAFQLYPKDFLSDENCKKMSLTETGAYFLLLLSCWLEGSIPADPKALAKLLRIRPSELSKIWPALRPCFVEGEPERLVNPRLEKERAKQIAYRNKRSRAGRKGARTRWKAEPQPDSNAMPLPSPENGKRNAVAMASDSFAVSLETATDAIAIPKPRLVMGGALGAPAPEFVEPTDEDRARAAKFRAELERVAHD